MGIVGPHISGHNQTMIPVLELCVHCVVARHLLPGRHLPSGSSEAEAGTGQTKQVSVDTGMLLETGYLSIPPSPLPPAIVLLIPPTSTLPTLRSPMGARHRVPSGQCPHSRRDNVLTCGGGAVGGAVTRGGAVPKHWPDVWRHRPGDMALSHAAGTQAV